MKSPIDHNSGDWIVPFKGRNHSGTFNQNFLWRNGSTYIMDNHRAALWCWMKHVDPKKTHSLFHIDRHYDTLQSNMKVWLPHFPKRWDMSIHEYLALSYTFDDDESRTHELFRFDNYLSLYLSKFKRKIRTCYFATHEEGDKPNYKGYEVPPWELVGNVDYWIDTPRSPWILNIDLDYFFCSDGEYDPRRMISDEYITLLFGRAKKVIHDGHVAVTTIALSPEWCGGWEASEQGLSIALESLGLRFRLPA